MEDQPHKPRFTAAIYGIYDNKAEEFPGRFLHVHRHEATAMRDFTELCTDPNTAMAKHPDDFDLVRLGYLDHETKQLIPDPHTITTARRVLDVIAANHAAKENDR